MACAFHGQPVNASKPRMARCAYCKTERLSSERDQLPFFEDKSDESDTCLHCHYFESAHEKKKAGAPGLTDRICDNFEPHGAWAWDMYYCGCRGWD